MAERSQRAASRPSAGRGGPAAPDRSPARPTPAKPKKPAKPYEGFPLFPHATRRWAKKIRGRFVFFGPWEDPHGALERYLAQRNELHAGLVPRGPDARLRPRPVRAVGPAGLPAMAGRAGLETADAEAPLLRDVVNHFLTAKQRRVEGGEMTRRSFADYHGTAGRLIQALGASRRVDDIDASDFGKLRAALAEGRGPVSLSNEIQRVRSVFKHAYDAGLVERPVRFGPEFTKPSRRTLRLAWRDRGPMMFEPPEVRKLLAAAGVQMRAMILLGLNAGLGNSDIGELERSAIDLRKGVIDFPRPKTSIPRLAKLWPESVEAIKAALEVRPAPKLKGDADLVFVTKYGHRWVRVAEPGSRSKGKTLAVTVDAVGLEFGKLLRELKLARPGRGFYALRHTFRTVADEVGDRPAVDLIMGHQDGSDISTHYVERIAEARLRKVAEHVSQWLSTKPRRSSRGR